MFIGHLPAGYIAGRLLRQSYAHTGVQARWFIAAAMLGGIAPDFDLLYFYLIDHRQHHHHSYWPHFPIVWLSLLVVSCLWYRFSSSPSSSSRPPSPSSRAALAMIFSISGCIHICLDSIVGDIWWFAPFVDQPFALFTVKARYQPWWLNFILHWTFALELLIVTWAIALWWRKPRR